MILIHKNMMLVPRPRPPAPVETVVSAPLYGEEHLRPVATQVFDAIGKILPMEGISTMYLILFNI